MGQKVTISDIAKTAGVSISSVHLALNNKNGVSEATRERIRRVAKEMNYSPNVFASNLKKETSTILVVLPERSGISDHYYGFMWDAARDLETVASTYNARIHCCSCSEALEVLDSGEANIAGIVVAALDNSMDSGIARVMTDTGVPLISVDTKVPYLNCCCCFAADARDVGNLTGELLVDTIHRPDGQILVLGAGPSYTNREAVERHLTRQLSAVGLDSRLLIINADEADEKCLQTVEEAITRNVIIGACSVNSRSTPILCEAIERTGRRGLFPVIGSGLFEETKGYLLNKTLTAIVDKKPYEQCYRAISAMIGILAKGIQPESPFIPIRLDVILRSNVAEYNSFRMV